MRGSNILNIGKPIAKAKGGGRVEAPPGPPEIKTAGGGDDLYITF